MEVEGVVEGREREKRTGGMGRSSIDKEEIRRQGEREESEGS